jgi:hypothetical protein
VNSKRARDQRASLKGARTDAEILALLRVQCVQFLYGAVRNACRHIRQNRLNSPEQAKARDLSAINSRRASRNRQSPVPNTDRCRRYTITRSERTVTPVHLSSSLSISEHLRPPHAINNHRVSLALIARHW